jgi:hypothetical protein
MQSAVDALRNAVSGSHHLHPTGVLAKPGVLRVASLLALYIPLWLLLTPYIGQGHDSQAYAIQALAKIKPQFTHDIFLAYRSQEEFTVFPTIYVWFIERFGLDSAAAWLTVVCQLTWYTAAYLLLRRLAGPALALVSIGLLIVVPGNYGGSRIFSYAEGFLTARLPAEALSLLAIWLFLRGNAVACAICLAIAMLLHPLMAFPAGILVALLWTQHRFGARPLLGLMAVGAIVAVIGAYVLGLPEPIMESRWLAVTELRSGFLFLDRWQALDWNYTLQSIATLAIAASLLRATDLGRVAYATLLLGLAGLALTALTTFAWHLHILIEGQAWRWLWLSRFLSIAALPIVLLQLWRTSDTGRSTALLLAAGWLFIAPLSMRSAPLHLVGAALTLLALTVWLGRARLDASQARTILLGGKLILAAVAVASLITISLAWSMASSANLDTPGVAGDLRNLIRLTTPAIFLVAGAAWVVMYLWTPARGAGIALVGILLMLAAIPRGLEAWTAQRYSGANNAAFADWRAQMPPNSQVFWYEHLQETWFLLERPSYLTRSQMGGVVFSHELVDEFVRRALVLAPVIDPNFWLVSDEFKPNIFTREIVGEICRDPELNFIVAYDDLGTGVPAKHWPTQSDSLYLLNCNQFRGSQATNDARGS